MIASGDPGVPSATLEGHLSITRELVLFLTADRKLEVGCNPKETAGWNPKLPKVGLVKELVEDWIFPASKLWVTYSTIGTLPADCHTTAVRIIH